MGGDLQALAAQRSVASRSHCSMAQRHELKLICHLEFKSEMEGQHVSMRQRSTSSVARAARLSGDESKPTPSAESREELKPAIAAAEALKDLQPVEPEERGLTSEQTTVPPSRTI